MTRVKRCIAVILSLAIVITGICWSEAPAKEVQAANGTEVNTEMLELKFQRGQGSISNKIRVVASVDSPNYSAVGFAIDKGDGNGEKLFTINTKEYPLPQRIKSTVYNIDGTEMRMDYSFSPKVIDTSSEYFLTAKWNAVEGTQYTVRAWVKTFDDEMVFGQSRCITLDDLSATNNYLNMSFELKSGELTTSTDGEKTTYNDIDVTYNEKSTKAKVISVKGSTVHVNVQNVNRTELPSVTEFVFGDYGSSTFRNLYTSYEGTDDADTTWYDADETEYVIATSADLYGLANVVNGEGIESDAFANKTIYVVSDIEVNKNQKITIATNNTATVTGNDFEWSPIGKTTAFAGTFDGNMHKISGIYAVSSEANLGLFAATAEKSSIQNLKLENSYFDNSTNTTTEPHGLGSIVGTCKGNLVNIYSKAYVKSKHYSGGLVGEILTSSADPLNIQKCWFDGMIYATGSRHGGIVGRIAGGEIVMTDCLNTGSIDCNNQNLKGGLCGSVTNDSGYTTNVTMIHCLNAGLITDYVVSTTAKNVQTGSIVGTILSPAVVTTEGVYATKDSYNGTKQRVGQGYGIAAQGDKFQEIESIPFEGWEKFDTSIWKIDDTTNKPALKMTMPVPE